MSFVAAPDNSHASGKKVVLVRKKLHAQTPKGSQSNDVLADISESNQPCQTLPTASPGRKVVRVVRGGPEAVRAAREAQRRRTVSSCMTPDKNIQSSDFLRRSQRTGSPQSMMDASVIPPRTDATEITVEGGRAELDVSHVPSSLRDTILQRYRVRRTEQSSVRAQLQELEHSRKVASAAERRILHTKPPHEQIEETRQQRALHRWERAVREWERQQTVLAKITCRESGETNMAQSEDFRRRKEEIELLDTAVPAHLRYGQSRWEMTLRQQASGGAGVTFVQIGSSFPYPIFCPVKEQSSREFECVRMPSKLRSLQHSRDSGRVHHSKSVVDSEYFLSEKKRWKRFTKKILEYEPEMDDLEVVGRAIFDEDQLREFANRPLTVHEFLDDVTYAEHDDSSELSSDDDVDDDDEYIREHVVEVDITSQNKKFVDKKIGILQSIPTTMNIADPISELISLPPVEGPHCALSSGSVSVELNPHQVGVVSVFLRNLGTVALILTWTRDNSSGIVHGQFDSAHLFVPQFPTECVIQPDQLMEFSFSVSSPHAGLCISQWVLSSNPPAPSTVFETSSLLGSAGVHSGLTSKDSHRTSMIRKQVPPGSYRLRCRAYVVDRTAQVAPPVGRPPVSPISSSQVLSNVANKPGLFDKKVDECNQVDISFGTMQFPPQPIAPLSPDVHSLQGLKNGKHPSKFAYEIMEELRSMYSSLLEQCPENERSKLIWDGSFLGLRECISRCMASSCSSPQEESRALSESNSQFEAARLHMLEKLECLSRSASCPQFDQLPSPRLHHGLRFFAIRSLWVDTFNSIESVHSSLLIKCGLAQPSEDSSPKKKGPAPAAGKKSKPGSNESGGDASSSLPEAERLEAVHHELSQHFYSSIVSICDSMESSLARASAQYDRVFGSS